MESVACSPTEAKENPKYKDCWVWFTEDREKTILQIKKALTDPDVDYDRLYCNFAMRVATGRAAMSIGRFAAITTQTSPSEILERWYEGAGLINNQSDQPVVAELNWTQAIFQNTPDHLTRCAKIVESLRRQLQNTNWPVARLEYWTRHCFHAHLEQIHSQFVIPIAGYSEIPLMQSADAGGGFIVHLQISKILNAGKDFFDDPDTALWPLSRTLFKSVKRESRRCAGVRCFSIGGPEGMGTPILDGDSLSGAAAVGFTALGQGLPYNPECIIVAKSSGRRLRSVGYELDKLDAALNHEWKDTQGRRVKITQAVIAQDSSVTDTEVHSLHHLGLEVIRCAYLRSRRRRF